MDLNNNNFQRGVGIKLDIQPKQMLPKKQFPPPSFKLKSSPSKGLKTIDTGNQYVNKKMSLEDKINKEISRIYENDREDYGFIHHGNNDEVSTQNAQIVNSKPKTMVLRANTLN